MYTSYGLCQANRILQAIAPNIFFLISWKHILWEIRKISINFNWKKHSLWSYTSWGVVQMHIQIILHHGTVYLGFSCLLMYSIVSNDCVNIQQFLVRLHGCTGWFGLLQSAYASRAHFHLPKTIYHILP